METVGLNHTAVLYALGWAIAHSLWQMGLLWLIYQLFLGLPKNVKPAYRYGTAVLFVVTGFIWFTITFADQFHTYQSINRYIEQLPMVESDVLSSANVADNTSGAIINSLFSTFERFIPYLSAGYLAVLIFLFVRLINAYGYTQKIRTQGLVPAGDFWDHQLLQFTRKLGLSENIKVYLTELIDVPATIGFVKPVILLPIATINHLSTEQVESIILHELAHIRRQDYLLNILISVLETILFFNPFAYLLVNVLKKERELFCDDFVVAFKNDPHNYATALLHLEKLRKGSTALLAVAATGHDGVLLTRVKRIMKVNAQPFQYREKLIALFFISGLLSALAWLDPVPSSPAHAATATVNNIDESLAKPTTIEDLIIQSETAEARPEKSATRKTVFASVKQNDSVSVSAFSLVSTDTKAFENEDLQTGYKETYLNDYPAIRFGSIAPRNPLTNEGELPSYEFDHMPLKKFHPFAFPVDSVNVLQLFKTTAPEQENEFSQLIEKALQLSAAQKPVPLELLSRIEQLKQMRFSFHYNEKNRRMKEKEASAPEARHPFDIIYFNEPPMHPRERGNLAAKEYRNVIRSTSPVKMAKGQSYVIVDGEKHSQDGTAETYTSKPRAPKDRKITTTYDLFIGDEMHESSGAAVINGWGGKTDSIADQFRVAPRKRKIGVAGAVSPSENDQFFFTDNLQASDNIRSTSRAKVIAGAKKTPAIKANTSQKITISIETSNELISIEFDQDEEDE